MTLDRNDLEKALLDNLELRGELAEEIAKSKDDSRHRVSRDFHRLGIVIALMAGAVSLVLIAHDAVIVRLWQVTYGDFPVVLGGVVEVAVVCLAV